MGRARRISDVFRGGQVAVDGEDWLRESGFDTLRRKINELKETQKNSDQGFE